MRAAIVAVVVATLACPASAQPRPSNRTVDVNLTPVPALFAPTGPILYRPQHEWTEWAPFTIPTYIGPQGDANGAIFRGDTSGNPRRRKG